LGEPERLQQGSMNVADMAPVMAAMEEVAIPLPAQSVPLGVPQGGFNPRRAA
jgi:hypothetical protein